MRRELTGVAAAKGLALGRACVREPHALDVEERRVGEHEVEGEIARLHGAIAAARAELAQVRDRLTGALAKELGEFLDLHTMILDDPDLQIGLDELIRTGRYSAEYALKLQGDRLSAIFEAMDDPYLRSRREDMDHVIGRVYAALHRGHSPQLEGVAGEVLVCDTVGPAELAQLSERGVVAIVTAQGSPLSHSAILARSLHLPLIVGVHEALLHINDGDALLVDAASGRVVVEPEADDLRDFRKRQREDARELKVLSKLKGAATRTLDGVDIRLHANAESRADVAQAHALGAAGVGLYRTEFLFMQRRELPTEDEQFTVYRELVLGMGGRPCTLRTLDLGADKADSSGVVLAHEPNPALGLRGVRLSLMRGALFRAQMRAMLRTSAYGPVRILVPMVSCLEEVQQVRRLLEDCAAELRAEGLDVAENVALGAMIEVPAAALVLPSLLPHLDFVSVGTNDLIQYLLAADRGNDAVASLYTPLHPAVLRLLHDTIEHGRNQKVPVTICGELAGDARYTRLLLALGLEDFSMHPGTLLEVRRVIRDSDHHLLRKQAPALLQAFDRASIERLLAGL